MKINDKQHITRRGVVKRNPPKKVPVSKVVLNWYEGRIGDKYPITFNNITEANKWIEDNAYRDGPKSGGYNKHSITVYWKDGQKYDARLDVKHPLEPNSDYKIGEHIKDYLDWIITKSPDSQKEKNEARKFLRKYDLELTGGEQYDEFISEIDDMSN